MLNLFLFFNLLLLPLFAFFQEPFPSSLISDAERAASLSDKEYYDAKYAIPCSITGAMAAASGGALGFVFGFGSRIVRGVSPLVKNAGAAASSVPVSSRLAAALTDGKASAASFAGFGGIYSAAACAVSRARDVDADPLNGAIAGCLTGAALGWKSGPAGMAQSCAMLGGFSYFIDRMQGGQVAQAAEVLEGVDGEGEGDESGGLSRARRQQRQRRQRRSNRSSASSPDASPCSSPSSNNGSKCCTVGGPLGAAFASAFASASASSSNNSNSKSSSSSDPLSLLLGPGLRDKAENAARRLGRAVRGAAVDSVRASKARWEW